MSLPRKSAYTTQVRFAALKAGLDMCILAVGVIPLSVVAALLLVNEPPAGWILSALLVLFTPPVVVGFLCRHLSFVTHRGDD